MDMAESLGGECQYCVTGQPRDEEVVRAHVNREIGTDNETAEALDEIIAAAVRRLDRTK